MIFNPQTKINKPQCKSDKQPNKSLYNMMHNENINKYFENCTDFNGYFS